jgi:hypothetical protein
MRKTQIIGVDIFEGNVSFCKATGVYDEVHCDDALQYLPAQEDRSFDTVIATELIEHLNREDGCRLLDQLERVARLTVILSTPNYACIRPGAETLVGYNEWEHHLSHWSREDFSRRRFSVRGVSHKLYRSHIRGVYRLLRTFPTLDALCRAWAETHPRFGLNLLVAKNLDGTKLRFNYGTA